MGIETAEIDGKEFHERAVRLFVLTGLFQVDRLEDRIRIRIERVLAGNDLFHHIDGARPPIDDRLRPVFYRFTWLSPILLSRVPHALIFEPERGEA